MNAEHIAKANEALAMLEQAVAMLNALASDKGMRWAERETFQDAACKVAQVVSCDNAEGGLRPALAVMAAKLGIEVTA